jgi:hypothetical protein
VDSVPVDRLLRNSKSVEAHSKSGSRFRAIAHLSRFAAKMGHPDLLRSELSLGVDGLLFDLLDYGDYVFDWGAGDYAVAEVEDVAGAACGLLEDFVYAGG